jgi:hypothetical protein
VVESLALTIVKVALLNKRTSLREVNQISFGIDIEAATNV